MVAAAGTLQIHRPHKWSRPQIELINFRAPPFESGAPRIEIVGGVGQYGGGKTSSAARRFLKICSENGFDSTKHTERDPPRAGIVAPTMGGMKGGTLPQLFAVLDDRLILDTKFYGDDKYIKLVNGVVVSLYSADGAVDGPSLFALWADEIHKPCYAGVDVWKNLQSRVRDGRAKRPSVIATGIARAGLPERLFRGTGSVNRKTVMFQTRDNLKHLAAGVLDDLLATTPSTEMELDADGWSVTPNVVWANFGAHNMTRAPSLGEMRGRVTHLGIDLGNKSAIVFGQDIDVETERPSNKLRVVERGLLLMDQLLGEGKQGSELARMIVTNRERFPWRIGEGSVMCFDPTASGDEIAPFREAFPDAQVVQTTSGPFLEVETGWRCVGRALRDAAGNVRLFVHPRLVGQHERGIPECMRLYSTRKTKDDKYEHGADAPRYLVVQRLPTPDFSYQPLVGLDPDEGLRAPWG